MKSIQRALLWSLVPAVLGLLALAIFAVLYEVRDEINELFDAQLEAATYAQASPSGPLPVPKGDDDPRKGLVIITWTDGVPSYRSPHRVDLPEPPTAGFSIQTINGEPWRVFTRVAGNQRFEAAQPLQVRSEASSEISTRVTVPLALLVPLLVFTVLFLVRRGLRPLTRFTTELDVRTPGSLSSLSLQSLPDELLPMAVAMNHLLSRLHAALEAQEVFIADAAHELLTPLTALQVQVQMLERAKTPDRRERAIGDVRESLERCVHLARQLLTLARQSAHVGEAVWQPHRLTDLVRQSMARALPQAHLRTIDLGIVSETHTEIECDSRSIQTLLSNLLENAIKYTPAGGRVDVSIQDHVDNALVIISDSGPGVSEAHKARVFDRFYRAPGVESEGTGLGLSIAREVAERHGASIDLRSPGALGGLDAYVLFQRAKDGPLRAPT
jgi:two-component system OmpR family sensor kinase